MEFVKSLIPEHWQSFWYFTSEFNFWLIGVFETLVSTSVGTGNDSSESSIRLGQYRWSLKMASQNAISLEKSIAIVNTASAGQSEKRRSLQSSDPCSGGEDTRIGLSNHRIMELSHADKIFDEDSHQVQWPPAQAQARAQAMDEFQTDYDLISWGQNCIFDIGLAID